MKRLVWLVALNSLLASGCRDRPIDSIERADSVSDQSTQIVADSTITEDERSKLLAAKDALFTQLSGRLMEAVTKDGPAAAIDVCRVEAKSIASAVGEGSNAKIGRTGVRLRSADNQSPAWAKRLVDDKVDTPVFARLSNRHPVALLPIKLQSQCLICHGSPEQLAPGVKEQLAKLYPGDQAIGFTEGELRGWFWVELLD